MILRALLPIVCFFVFLAGCQPQPSPEYLEALKDFDAVTVKMIDKEFELLSLIRSGEQQKAEDGIKLLEKLAEQSSAISERLVGLRPSIPDSTLYAAAMKDRDDLQAKTEQLDFKKRDRNESLDSIKADVLDTQRKLYDAIERSHIHRPNN